MTKGVQQRRGSSSEHSTFKGQPGEVTVNTDRWTIVVQDGVTNGGYEHVGAAATQRITNKVISATSLAVSGITTLGDVSQFNVTGVGSFNANATVIIGVAGSTGTAGQDLQVAGGVFLSGNTGIGTTTPAGKLHVTPTATGFAGLFSGTTSEDMVRITQLGTGNCLRVEDETNPDATPFVIHSSGPVGTGTTAPGAQLHVQVAIGGPAPVAGLYTGSTTDNMVLISNVNTTGNALYVGLSTQNNVPGLLVGGAFNNITGSGSSVGFQTTGIGLTARTVFAGGNPTAIGQAVGGPGFGGTFTAPMKFVRGPVMRSGEHGAVEFDTPNFYMTGIATERGVVVAPQYFVLTADRALAPGALEQLDIFGRGCTLQGGLGIGTFRYAYELAFAVSKTSANAVTLGYGVTVTTGTINHHKYTAIVGSATTVGGVASAPSITHQSLQLPSAPALQTISVASPAAANTFVCNITGLIDVSTSVTALKPLVNFSAAPTAVTFASKAYMRIWPIGPVPTSGDFTGNSSWG